MANQFRNRSNQRRVSRPNRSWSGFITSARVAVAANSKVLLGGLTLSNTNIDETTLRTVGVLSIETDTVANAESQIGAFGLINVSDTAFGIGITAVPGPVTDAQDDGWFVYQSFAQSTAVATSVGARLNSVQYAFDSRGKRVNEEGTTIAIVIENGHATHGFNATVVFRLLSMVRGTG